MEAGFICRPSRLEPVTVKYVPCFQLINEYANIKLKNVEKKRQRFVSLPFIFYFCIRLCDICY
jgi:hypothetical protein